MTTTSMGRDAAKTRNGRPDQGLERGRTPHLPAMALAAVAILGVALALEVGLEGHDPFWLDESWTGGIISQPSWRDTFHQIYADVNAPLYYVVVRVWSGLFGLSDAALRAPSLIFAAAIPLAAALAPVPGLTRAQRLGWAAVLAWWFPTLCYAQEARCYALLLLVCTLQTIAFVRLMAKPGLGRAAVWAALGAVAILTHYDALYLDLAQGLIYLACSPLPALKTWPAALAFAPAFGWLAFHWPRIAQFARPDIAWYSPLHTAELPAIGDYMTDGGPLMARWLPALGIAALSLRLAPWPRPAAPSRPQAPIGWAVLAAALAAAAMVGVGFVRPSFTFRYLTPSEPGLLLGLVWTISALARRGAARLAIAMLAAVYLGISGWMLAHHLRMAPKRYNFEAASQALALSRPSRLVFLWDHPVDPILKPEQLAALGGFFLHRTGSTVVVDPVVLKPGEDPNVRLRQEATPPGSTILWLYDTVVKGTAAISYPPQPRRLAPGSLCRQYAGGRFGVLACIRSPESETYQRAGMQPQGSP